MKPTFYFYNNNLESVDFLPVFNVGVVHQSFNPVTGQPTGGERISVQFGWLSFGLVIFFKH